jgi:hypothetical protein
MYGTSLENLYFVSGIFHLPNLLNTIKSYSSHNKRTHTYYELQK